MGLAKQTNSREMKLTNGILQNFQFISFTRKSISEKMGEGLSDQKTAAFNGFYDIHFPRYLLFYLITNNLGSTNLYKNRYASISYLPTLS